MKQTDYFDRFDPPILNERMLRRELERRQERRRTVLLAIAGAMLELALVLFSVLAWERFAVVALGGICFAIISAAGSAAIAIVYTQKGGVGSECGC